MICRVKSHSLFLLLLVTTASVLFKSMVTTNAFTNHQPVSLKQAKLVSKLRMFNFLDDWMNFFQNKSSNDDNDDHDDEPAGQYRIASISVESIKPGGLRLFLMFYLLGMQNTPEANSWKAYQPTTKISSSSSLTEEEEKEQEEEQYVVEFWYHDHSAILSVTMSENDKLITINRFGSKPSTAYMMHESTIVQGILNELEQMATDQKVSPENRLLLIVQQEPEKNAIDTARDALAFG